MTNFLALMGPGYIERLSLSDFVEFKKDLADRIESLKKMYSVAQNVISINRAKNSTFGQYGFRKRLNLSHQALHEHMVAVQRRTAAHHALMVLTPLLKTVQANIEQWNMPEAQRWSRWDAAVYVYQALGGSVPNKHGRQSLTSAMVTTTLPILVELVQTHPSLFPVQVPAVSSLKGYTPDEVDTPALYRKIIRGVRLSDAERLRLSSALGVQG